MQGSEFQYANADGCVPSIVVLNRQRGCAVDLPFLRAAASLALGLCAQQKGEGTAVLMDLEEVVVTCVSDKRIDKVHREFMGIQGATDVITFQHGDILVSVDTAARAASEHGHGLNEELLMYIVHGFLHLNGYDDADEVERAAMHSVQDRVWAEVLGQVSRRLAVSKGLSGFSGKD